MKAQQFALLFVCFLLMATTQIGCFSDPDQAMPANTVQADAGDETDVNDSTTSPSGDAEDDPTPESDTGTPPHPQDASPPQEDTSNGNGVDETDVGDGPNGGDESDTGEPSDDTGTDPEDTGPSEPPPEDTGSSEPPPEDAGTPDPDDCGANFWDDHHDGSNPWDPFEIDCDELAASWDCQATDDEKLILEIINQYREEDQECGENSYSAAQPFEMNDQLQCAARIHSWDMDGRNYYTHDTPDGVSASQRVSIVPGSLSSAAENIYDFWGTPEGAVQGWMDSPGHCRNIMCSGYNQIGVGIYGTMHTLKITGPSVCWW